MMLIKCGKRRIGGVTIKKDKETFRNTSNSLDNYQVQNDNTFSQQARKSESFKPSEVSPKFNILKNDQEEVIKRSSNTPINSHLIKNDISENLLLDEPKTNFNDKKDSIVKDEKDIKDNIKETKKYEKLDEIGRLTELEVVAEMNSIFKKYKKHFTPVDEENFTKLLERVKRMAFEKHK